MFDFKNNLDSKYNDIGLCVYDIKVREVFRMREKNLNLKAKDLDNMSNEELNEYSDYLNLLDKKMYVSKKSTKIFFDTEFTGLHKNTSLISIGLIADNGSIFYGEITDYDKTQVDNWLQENVISNLWNTRNKFNNDFPNYFYFGNKEFIRKKLNIWLTQFNNVEWVSDVCHYDFVLLIDLVYGQALNMPYGIHCSACHDINQDIAKYYNISEIDAFDKSREDILKGFNAEIKGEKHNALYDAEVIKAIYEKIN